MAEVNDTQRLQQAMEELLQGKASMMEAIGLSLTDILALAQLARQLADQGQVDQARTILRGLVAVDPTNAYLLTCLGCVLMQQKDNARAAEAFAAALRLNPNDIVALTYGGELALEAGNLEAAVKSFQKAVELDPEGRDPYANRARTSALVLAAMAKEVQAKGPGVLKEIAAEAERFQRQPAAAN